MSNLVNILKNHKEEQSFTGCSVARWLATLTKEEGEAFIECLETPGVNALSLYNTLVFGGVSLPFKQTTFRYHVNGYCTCHQ